MNSHFSTPFQTAASLIEACKNTSLFHDMEKVSSLLIETLANGKKILVAGNGGSASEAQHFATELVIRYKLNRKALPMIALTSDGTLITAGANDLGYSTIFSRQVEALGQPGDVFIGLTTSGTSANVVEAFKTARHHGLKTVGFLGENTSSDSMIDFPLHVPSSDTPRIQEVHLMMIHALCDSIETHFFA